VIFSAGSLIPQISISHLTSHISHLTSHILHLTLRRRNQFAQAPVNVGIENMPAGKAARRIGIDKLAVNFLWHIKIFVGIAIREIYFEHLRLVFKIKYPRVGGGLAVFRSGLAAFPGQCLPKSGKLQ